VAPYLHAEAVVLRTGEYSESSQVVTLYARPCGKVRAIAKGARRPKARGGVGLDLLNLCDAVLVPKPPPALSIIAGWHVRNTFRGLRRHLNRLYAAMYAVELLDRATDEGDPDAETYDLLVRLLEALDGGTRPYPMLFRFELLLLRHAGLAPQTDRCVACGQADEIVGFSPSGGGIVCARCIGAWPDATRISPSTARALARLSGEAPPARVELSDRDGAEVRSLLDAHITYHLGRPLEMRRHVAIQSGTFGQPRRPEES